MFKTDSFLGDKKLSLNQNVWHDHATMQQDVLLHFCIEIPRCLFEYIPKQIKKSSLFQKTENMLSQSLTKLGSKC